MEKLFYLCAFLLIGTLTVNGATTPATTNDAPLPTTAAIDDVIADTTSPSWHGDSFTAGITPVVESSMAMTTSAMTSQSMTTNDNTPSSSQSGGPTTTSSVTSQPSADTTNAASSSGFSDATSSSMSSQTTPTSASNASTPGNPSTAMPSMTSSTPDVSNSNDTGMTSPDGSDMLSISQSPFTPDNNVLAAATSPDDMASGGVLSPSDATITDITTADVNMGVSDTTTTDVNMFISDTTTADVNMGVSDVTTTDVNMGISDTTTADVNMGVSDTTTADVSMGVSDVTTADVNMGISDTTTASTLVETTVVSATADNTTVYNDSSVSLNSTNSDTSSTADSTPTAVNNTMSVNDTTTSGNTVGGSTSTATTTTPPGMETTTVLQSVQDIINGFVLTTTPSPPTTTTADPCNLRPAQQCSNAVIGQFRTLLYLSRYVTNVASVVPWMCGSYPRYRYCILNSASTCNREQRLNYDMIVSVLDYVCSADGPKAVGEALPCYRNRNTTSGVVFCTRMSSSLAVSQGVCGMAQNYVNCVSKVYELKCSYAAGYAVKNILHRATMPLRFMLHCPAFIIPPTTTTTTTTTLPPPAAPATTKPPAPTNLFPQGGVIGQGLSGSVGSSVNNATSTASATPINRPQLKCYDCDSGDPVGAAYNARCSIDGEVSRRYIRATPCSAPCYSRVLKSPAGAVKRGCAAGMEALFPGGVIPTRGCHRRAGEVWCFCSRNGCNRRDMENFITVEVP